MTLKPAVMLFAAGRGTRMAPLTDERPKPMVEVAGKPLVDHALGLVRQAGLDRVVANTHYLPTRLETHLHLAGVQTIRETELLETGGGLRNALPLLGDGPVITLNSDAVWAGGNPISELLDAWQPDEMDALLTLIHPDSAVGHDGAGDFSVSDTGRLTRAPGFVYTGAQIMKPERLFDISDNVFSLNRVWDLIQAERRLFGVIFQGAWCDVGQPASIPMAEALLNV